MQTHFPGVPDPVGSKIDLDQFGQGWASVWDRLESGELSQERVWQSYLANLRHVLEEVERLLTNLDATNMVISADHGNAFGELNVYGHPPGCPVDTVCRVPWVETTATDTGGYEPTLEPPVESEESTDTIETRLQNLGYV
jgi:arylsulfatase A-like enzyme